MVFLQLYHLFMVINYLLYNLMEIYFRIICFFFSCTCLYVLWYMSTFIYRLISFCIFKIFRLINKFYIGTFAVVSLMSAQAIESVSHTSINLINNNNQSLSLLSNVADSVIINQKIGVATTLVLLVGIVQVCFTE